MRSVLRYVAALLAALLLLTAALLGAFCAVTTETFAVWAFGRESLLAQQQAEIDGAVSALTTKYQLSPEVLAPYAENAAARQSEALAAWWQGLWTDTAAETALPVYLDASQERELIAAVMADEGFIAATEEGQRRAIARDEIAFALDEAVCDAAVPLRRSIAELGVSMLADRMDLPTLRQAALIGAGVLAGAGLLCLLLAHRAAGGTLMATAVMMALVSVPVWLMDVPGMLKQLNPLAAKQGTSMLLCMGAVWYGAALALLLPGMLLIGIKRAVRRRRI